MPEYHLDTSLARETAQSLDAFTLGYIEAAMWTLTDDDGEPMDYLGLHDIAESTIRAAIRDCKAFQETYREDLDKATEELGRDDSSHGHDFWLTREGHGAGFWDRGYSSALSQRLTDGAQAFGSGDWYVGDDGIVYQSGDEDYKGE